MSTGEGFEQPAINVASNLNAVRERVQQATERAGRKAAPRLVAVSKTQPNEKLLAAYEAGTNPTLVTLALECSVRCRDFRKKEYERENEYKAGQRIFGENYVQEMVSKAPELPDDIQWHFIGSLQTNKAKSIVSIPNLSFVETVDREKLAATLDRSCEQLGRRLNIMLQVLVKKAAINNSEEAFLGCPQTAPLSTRY